MLGRDNVVAHLLEKGAEMDARDKVRIDTYLGSSMQVFLGFTAAFCSQSDGGSI
jgi:hypothetical protein